MFVPNLNFKFGKVKKKKKNGKLLFDFMPNESIILSFKILKYIFV